MSRHHLSFAAGGFFLYPIGADGRCEAIAAPRVTGIDHRCLLIILGSAQTSGVAVRAAEGIHVVELENCTVRFDDRSFDSGATVGDISGIVPFHEICSGVKLAQGWRSKANVSVLMPPGDFCGHPEVGTNTVRWRSVKTKKTTDSEFVSSGATLTTWDDWDGVIRIGTIGWVQPAPNARMLFWHDAIRGINSQHSSETRDDEPARDPVDSEAIAEDLSHVASMLALCEPLEQLELEFGVVLRRSAKDIFSDFKILAKPRINCGGRWIEAS